MLTLSLHSGADRVARTLKGEEERVALRVDLDAVARAERLANDAPMRGQHVAIGVPETLEKLGRVLDVGEREGDRSPGQIRHEAIVVVNVAERR